MKKFNTTWKNKGSINSSSPKINATMMQQITDNIDELIDLNKVTIGSIELYGSGNIEIVNSRVKQIGKIVYICLEIKLLADINTHGGLVFSVKGVSRPSVSTFVVGYYSLNRWQVEHILASFMGASGEFNIYNTGEVCKSGGYIKFSTSYIVD